ncbi:uncharacterized protein KD926_001312 [Aspergillus affinis]|uniref:uncharacterized protein n=1 Tax=Aspergillus affinis TaxID=1070780 RepID=UPI0022FEFF9B|nr:uncharacterized protein KD926_001312 [Aspergillus affinis]KAI9036790.1 hypothetical protein KD926_001312 [Aspergillus affinis]
MNHVSDSELISFCLNGPPDNLIGDRDTRIVKVSKDTAIKFGMSISEDEFLNHQIAYDLVDQTRVQIPRAHRFFTDGLGRGYIVVEHVEGNVIDPLTDPVLIKRLSNVLNYLHTIRGTKPGSLSGGPCHGLLWPDNESVMFESKEQLESWLNSRLSQEGGNVSLEDDNLVLCHLDVTPRNIIWKPDGSICLVGWASAGFYPRLFEFWAQWVVDGKEGPFNKLLLNLMKPLSCDEKLQQWPLCRIWHANREQNFRPNRNLIDVPQPTEQEKTTVRVPETPVALPSVEDHNSTPTAVEKVNGNASEHYSKRESRPPKTIMSVSLRTANFNIRQFSTSHPIALAAVLGTVAILGIWVRKRQSI